MTATDLARLSAAELLNLYRRKAASPVEATRACLERIDQFNDKVGAYCLVDHEGALAAARASEARWQAGRPQGLLDGVPTSIKDLSLAAGWPTRRGSRTTDGAPPDTVDSPPVARLREHGAVFLGKTTTPEFGWKGVTDNPRGDVARNPWDVSRTAGGSSGGAAVAAALGMGALHTGSDGGGSIRMPAGFTGIVGIKPTFGRIPTWPHSPFGTVSHIGPMTRTVTDTALMLTALAGADARDWHALPADGRDYRVGLEQGVRGLRIAASADLGYAEVDPEIRDAFERAVETLGDLGAVVERADPGFASPRDMFCRHWFSAAAHLGRGLSPDKLAMLDPGLLEVMEEGRRVDAAGLYELQAQRTDLGMQAQLFFERYDLLVTPTLPLLAFEAGVETPDRRKYPRWIDWSPFSYPFNLTQQPAASVPCGFSAGGLPIGLHLVGAKYADALVLRAARAFEAARPQPMPEAPRG